MADNTLFDNNRITELIQIGAFFKVFKLIITIFNVAIIITAMQYIYYEIIDDVKQGQFNNMSNYDLNYINSKSFISYYNFKDKDDYTKFITMLYYTLTTLSTIGFGDYCPRADEERMFNVIIFLVGVSVTLYLMNCFTEIIMKFQQLYVDFDEGDKLTIFFDLFRKLNGEKEIDSKLKLKIMLHFDNKWKTDRN